MSKKQINFNRLDKNLYREKFEANWGASNWPPKDGAEPNVANRLGDLILFEAKGVIKPQLEANKLTLPSHQVMLTIISNVSCDAAKTPAEHYDLVSDRVFKLLEEQVPGLLGQEDPSNWAFMPEFV